MIKYNKRFWFYYVSLLFLANIHGLFLKDKKYITVTNDFQKVLVESNCKSNEILDKKYNDFFSRQVKSWLWDNDIEMCSKHDWEKYFIAERFISTSKNKIYKYMTAISKNVYTDKLDDTVNEYNNNKDHRTIRMKSFDIKSSTYVGFNVENINKDPKFEVGDHARISIYKKIFAKVNNPNKNS